MSGTLLSTEVSVPFVPDMTNGRTALQSSLHVSFTKSACEDHIRRKNAFYDMHRRDKHQHTWEHFEIKGLKKSQSVQWTANADELPWLARQSHNVVTLLCAGACYVRQLQQQYAQQEFVVEKECYMMLPPGQKAPSAASFVVETPLPPPAPSDAPSNPVHRLMKAKQLLDSGLCTQEDYDAMKQVILGEMEEMMAEVNQRL